MVCRVMVNNKISFSAFYLIKIISESKTLSLDSVDNVLQSSMTFLIQKQAQSDSNKTDIVITKIISYENILNVSK